MSGKGKGPKGSSKGSSSKSSYEAPGKGAWQAAAWEAPSKGSWDAAGWDAAGDWDSWDPWSMLASMAPAAKGKSSGKGSKGSAASPWDMMAMLMSYGMMKGATMKGGSPWGAEGGKSAPSAKTAERSAAASGKKVFVGGMTKETTQEEVEEFFGQFGSLREVKMMMDDEGVSKGFCFVTFEHADDAQRVFDNYEGNIIDGAWIDCRPASHSSGPANKDKPAIVPKAGDWWCPKCDNLCFARKTSCQKCGFVGQGIPAGGVPAGQQGKPGDWLCTACGDLVFARRDKCNKCGEPKSQDAERIGLKPGDWNCPGCGDLVFASKSVCSMCQTPKPDGGQYSAAPSKGSSKGRASPY